VIERNLTKTLTDSLGSWARVVAILPVILLETVLDAAPVFGAEFMMLLRRFGWIAQEKLRLIWRQRTRR
jgi:hypothetical protein